MIESSALHLVAALIGALAVVVLALAIFLPQVTAAETVVVSGRPSMVDVKSSAANTQIDNELLQNLPTQRFQPDIINLAPGITNSVAYGGTASSNALLIDGMNVSDPDDPPSCLYVSDLDFSIGSVQLIRLDPNRGNYPVPLLIRYPIGARSAAGRHLAPRRKPSSQRENSKR